MIDYIFNDIKEFEHATATMSRLSLLSLLVDEYVPENIPMPYIVVLVGLQLRSRTET